MRYGIFSDVHSNLEAFEAVIEFYRKEKIDKFIYLGDIVGYGANPNECISLLKILGPVCIAGNHDWAVIGKLPVSYFNSQAGEVISWTKNKLKKENICYLHTFALTYEEGNFICVHGDLVNPEKFRYISDSIDAQINFSYLKAGLCFIGHSHKAEIYCWRKKKAVYFPEFEITISSQEKYIINVGSVGQPRDKDNRACLCIYDTDEAKVTLKRISYNIKKTGEKILKNHLPPIFAMRLYEGW